MKPEIKLQAAEAIHHVEAGLIASPFHPRTEALNSNRQWINWNGFAAAAYYRDQHIEYFATRNSCGLFDVSPMRKYRIHGEDCEAMLNRMVTRDVSKQKTNSVAYNVWCNDRGRIVDDGTLFRYERNDFMICCSDPCFDWFSLSAVGFEQVSIEDISDQLASLALQGPTSCALLKALGFSGIEHCKPFEIMYFTFGAANTPLMISRTGFTGDLGYELWINPDYALDLWDALFEKGELYGIQPLGDNSLDMARLEAGFISPELEFHGAQHSVNLGHDHSPFELGLDWIVNFKKTHFNGRSALLAEKQAGPAYKLS
ncbi:MAG: aminomethyl transferase family protein [Halieaceae bacterium]|nr:aminomethyl transferase family protein [Halieaceae bacterium]